MVADSRCMTPGLTVGATDGQNDAERETRRTLVAKLGGKWYCPYQRGGEFVADSAAALDRAKQYEATVTTKGQVTIPQKMRLDLDIREGDRLVFTKLDDARWVLSRIVRQPPDIDALRGRFRTPGDPRTTDEVMEEVRGRRPGKPLP